MVDPRRLVDALGVQRLDFSQMLTDQVAFAPHMRGTALSYVIETPDGYAAYAEGRRAAGSGIIKDIDKRRRKVEREVGPVRFTAPAADTAAFDQLLAWKRAQYRATGQTDVFAAPWTTRAAARPVRRRETKASAAASSPCISAGRLAAAQFNLLGRHTVARLDHRPRRGVRALFAGPDAVPGHPEMDGRGRPIARSTWARATTGSSCSWPACTGPWRTASSAGPRPRRLFRGAQYGVRAAAEALPLGSVSQLPGQGDATHGPCGADCDEARPPPSRLRALFRPGSQHHDPDLRPDRGRRRRLKGHIERTPCRHSKTLSQITGRRGVGQVREPAVHRRLQGARRAEQAAAAHRRRARARA